MSQLAHRLGTQLGGTLKNANQVNGSTRTMVMPERVDPSADAKSGQRAVAGKIVACEAGLLWRWPPRAALPGSRPRSAQGCDSQIFKTAQGAVMGTRPHAPRCGPVKCHADVEADNITHGPEHPWQAGHHVGREWRVLCASTPSCRTRFVISVTLLSHITVFTSGVALASAASMATGWSGLAFAVQWSSCRMPAAA